MKQVQLVCLVILATWCGVCVAMIKPPVPLHNLNPIDACLFACNMCYTKEVLLDCANKVCLGDLREGRDLDKSWARTCPGLSDFFRWK